MTNDESDEILDPETLQKRLNGSVKLVETTCRLAAQHDLDQILELVTSSVCEALDCERASLYLYDEEHGEVYTRVVTELEIEEIRSSIENSITGWVARRRKIANIPDPFVDARWNSAIDKITGFHTLNILAAPLISTHDDRLVGVLQLLNKREGSFDEFDEQLIQAFASHAATALERAQLLEQARQSHELQLSAEMGHRIQSSFLPSHLPEIPGYEVAAWWQPAESVSGDYYDLVKLRDGRLGLVVADVSGHGIGPSLIMASVRAMLHVLTLTISEPEKILSLLSETITPDLHDGRFITFLMVALDSQTHEMTFANAGHAPALHFERASGRFHSLESTGLPIGFDSDDTISAGRTIRLAPGDVVLLATDGVIELMNEQREMFGRERLERLVRENCKRSAADILSIIRDAVNEFHPHTHPPDDVTVMVLERKLE